MLNEVAPPGFGHTKPDKEKGVKKGGTAAAFKRALDRGDFKGLPGSRTKKEKTADMFKIMWAQKKKGAKPHYKPGTDKKYKKYQEEETSMQDNNLFGNAYAGSKDWKKKNKKAMSHRYKTLHKGDTSGDVNEGLSTKDSKKLNKAAVLSYSDDPKDQHRARVRQAEIDFKDLMRQKAKKKKMKEEYVIEREDSPYEHASRGSLAGKTRSTGTSEKEDKTSFRRKAHRNSAAMIIRAKRNAERSGKKLSDDSAADLAHKGWASSVKHHKSSMTPEQQKRRQKLADTPYKKLSKDEQDKDKVSAKAIMSVHDKQKKK